MLGKVPKPVNLPSQRLENRGLDPNVEIVPKGTLSWRTTGRSPPTSGSAWGSATFSSSPPASAGAWGRSSVSTARPSSGGSGTRPSTASSDQSHEPVTPNAWGSASSRPSSASGAVGLAHSQLTVNRPCSAESRTCSSQLSRFADPSVESGGPWGGSGIAHKLGDNHPHPSHFTLTSGDFPSLGSDKNPNLRPQQGNASTIRSMPSSEVLAQKDRPRLSPPDWSDDVSTGSTPMGQDRGTAETWKRESASYPQEIPRSDDGQPHREGLNRQTFVSSDSWHCEDGHTASMTSNLSEDEWHRGGPPVGPYGPPTGHGRFPFNSPGGYMRPPFEYGPLPFAQGQPGPGGYGRPGEMYRPCVAQPMVPGQPGLSRGHGMYSNQLPYDGYYGPPGVTGPHYGSAMGEREMAMVRMGGPSLHGGYPQNQGRHLDGPRFRRGGPGSGPRPVSFRHTLSREHTDPSSYNRVASDVTDKAHPKQMDFWAPKDMDNSSDNNHMFFSQDSNMGLSSAASTNRQNDGNNPREAHSGHCDWGTISSDEPMDFSKPVFDDKISRLGGFADSNNSDIENNHERKGNVPRFVDEPRSCDNKTIQAQIIDDVDSCNSSATGNLNQRKKNKFVEVDTQKVTVLEDQFLVGQENEWEVGITSKDEKKIVSRLDDEKVYEEEVHFAETGESTTNKVDTVGRNHRIVERAQALMTSPKALDQQGTIDGHKRVSVVSSSSSERSSGLNKFVKLQGGLSSAAGSNNTPYETLKVRDKVHLLKRSDNHPTSDVLDTEGDVEKVHGAEGGKGSSESFKSEGQTMKSRFNVHEGDNEWRRKVPTTEPTVKEMKVNITATSQASRQVVASMPGSGTHGSESVDNKSALECHTQQSHGSQDYEAQRARMKESAAQRLKQRQKEEEERTKERMAKALAKLEELNRRDATSQEGGNPSSETISSGPVVSEAMQQEQVIVSQNKNSELLHIASDKTENIQGGSFAEGNYITNADDRSRPKLREQNGLLKEQGTHSDSDTIQVSEVAPVEGNFRKNDFCDIPINVSKYDKGKQESFRRTNNVSKEDLKHQMKMNEQKGHVKERSSDPTALNEAPVIIMQDMKVSPSTSTQISETLQTDVPVPESDSSRNVDQHHQFGFPKQTRIRPKTKQQYVADQKSLSFQPSTVEKTGQPVVPSSGNSVKLVSENDGLHMSSSSMLETSMPLSSPIAASGNDGASAARKKKYNRNVKGKHKTDKQGITVSSVGSSEHDISMSTQTNSIGGDSKHGVENITSNSIKEVNNDVDMWNGKSEFTSVGAGWDDVNVAHDTPGGQGVLQSKDDASAGRIPHFKSQFSKRSYRGSQDLRASEKSQGNEGMVWTPVRVVNPNVMSTDKQKLDQTGVEVQPSGVSNDVVAQNPVKNRRAEMERYVPKPVAKEQAQIHENYHQHAASSLSTQVQTDQSSSQQGIAKNAGIAETRQQHSSVGENKGHVVGNKHAKQTVSWRQRNSSEISKSHKASQESVEVHSAASLQVNEVTVSKTIQSPVETQDLKSEGIGNQPKSEQPDMHKTTLEQLPKVTAVKVNKQENVHSETVQNKQSATLQHLPTGNIAKVDESQMASKREQNMHERFYQASRSRSKPNKYSFRPVHTEGNHQFSKVEGKNEEFEKTHPSDQIIPHQRPKSSGSWTPKQQGLSDNKEHFSQSISVGQIEIGQIKIGSLEEYGGFQRQSAQQMPSNAKGDAHQQEGPSLPSKQQHVQNHSSQQLVSPHQFEQKNQGPSHNVVNSETDNKYQQQSKPTNVEKQAIEREQPKQASNSSSYQQRRVSSGQGHWQQTRANYGANNTRRTDSHEHPRATVVQSRKQQGTTIQRASESSPEAGRHERQDINNQQVPIEIPKRQNPQGHSQPFSNQKPQEFYQPKAGSVSGDNEKHEISHSTASRSGSSWTGDHRSNHQYRDRDHNSERRGRSGGRNGGGALVAKRNESESKSERLSNQRLVVDATGGAIPHHVAGWVDAA